MRVKSIVFVITFLFVSLFTKSNIYSKESKKDIEINDIKALSAVLIDGKTKRVLFGKKENKKMQMASTTKILTLIVALENHKNVDIVEISKNAAMQPKVHMNVKPKEKYHMKDLLYAMMLESYNDVAVAVAEGCCKTVKNFSEEMNAKAKEIGAYNSNFVTPNGLDRINHYSTALDMALIGAYGLNNKTFKKIVNTKTYSFTDVSGKRKITVNNKDSYLTMDKNAVGIKTGYTNKAGYCFVGGYVDKDKTLISCVLGSGWPPNKSFKWNDTKKIMEYGKINYKSKRIIPKTRIFNMSIKNGNKKVIRCRLSRTPQIIISKKDKIDLVTKIKYAYPIKKNEAVGVVKIFVNKSKVQEEKIYSMSNAVEYDYKYCLTKFFYCFLLQ